MVDFKKAVNDMRELRERMDRLAFRHKLDREILEEVCTSLAINSKKSRKVVLDAIEDKFDNNGMTNAELLQLRDEIFKRERKANLRFY